MSSNDQNKNLTWKSTAVQGNATDDKSHAENQLIRSASNYELPMRTAWSNAQLYGSPQYILPPYAAAHGLVVRVRDLSRLCKGLMQLAVEARIDHHLIIPAIAIERAAQNTKKPELSMLEAVEKTRDQQIRSFIKEIHK